MRSNSIYKGGSSGEELGAPSYVGESVVPGSTTKTHSMFLLCLHRFAQARAAGRVQPIGERATKRPQGPLCIGSKRLFER